MRTDWTAQGKNWPIIQQLTALRLDEFFAFRDLDASSPANTRTEGLINCSLLIYVYGTDDTLQVALSPPMYFIAVQEWTDQVEANVLYSPTIKNVASGEHKAIHLM